MDKQLFRLIYSSLRKENCDASEIDNILNACKKNNPGKDITGILLHSDKKFIQYLEGDSKEILGLYDHIKKDDRHKSVVMLSYGPIKQRNFPSWHMGYKNISLDKLAFQTSIDPADKEVFISMIEGKKQDDDRGIAVLKKFFESV
ncbi:BLUF domain-containing protein [Fulvivirga sp. 29W222]|uniref:BLUF domain-containing protein n=1 Tax=Fulvivirga marina TaxID=2494733 RepID=A0A937G0B2_9BACT|nr:BLUF domain-containing protein [Fulvivirga marina]MBL6448167.1 BLUF domain-containing protein [Fulvivirga marina]